jgi:5-methylthioribose kinase
LEGNSETALLDVRTVVPYLVRRGLLHQSAARGQRLAGGVSNVVLAASGDHEHVVVKQALAKLRVADDWYAPQERAMIEADALDLAATLTPGHVPRLIHRDPARHAIVMERAPAAWKDWKTLLLDGTVQPRVATELGNILAYWHTETSGGAPLPATLDSTSHFELLRLEPYYRTVARRAPEISSQVLNLADRLLACKTCFVHGDFSPKNILIGRDQFWVIDFEVAHRGDPAFDIAFLLHHLVLKSVHLPQYCHEVDGCARGFVDAYTARVSSGIHISWEYVFSHLACMLLARVKGKSPAEYLSASEQQKVWRLGTDLLAAPPRTIADLFLRRDELTQ